MEYITAEKECNEFEYK